MRAAVDREISAGSTRLVVDLSGVEFIDSSGLRVLVRLQNTALREGLHYTLISGPPQVHRTFVLCGLDQKLPFAA